LKLSGLAVLCFAACISSFAQDHPPVSGAQQSQPTSPSVAAIPSSNKFALDDGTPVKLRLDRTLSSADAKTGDNIDFEVLEEIKVHDVLVIPKGSIAIGTVTDAEHKKRMARGGKLDIEIDYVKLADGEKATLRAVKETKGGGHTGAMTGAIVATAIVVWPAAPFFLFMHGKDTEIPKGTEITAYVNGVMPLDEAKFVPAITPGSNVANSSATVNQSSPGYSQLQISSTPAGAEISIDGNFVGDTPSELSVAVGPHTITISKHGFRQWERKMTVSGGKISIVADLEQ
jgi:PEGA domain